MSNAVAIAETPFEDLAKRADDCLEVVNKLDDDAKKAALELKQVVDDLNTHAITKLVRLIRESDLGQELLYEALEQPEIYTLFLTHGIIQPSLETQVAQALELIKPYVQSHGGDVELVEIQEDVAYVRLHGSCSGCSMSAQTLKDGVTETVIKRVPQISRIEEVKEDSVAGFISLDSIRDFDDGNLASMGWVEGPLASQVIEGRPFRVQGDDYNALVVRLEGRLFAYRNECPHMGMPLERGECEGSTLTCPWHSFQFDLTSGECITAPSVQLEPYPLRLEDGRVWLRPS
ncbi:MAG: NifU family protein [Deinococcota bacterium]